MIPALLIWLYKRHVCPALLKRNIRLPDPAPLRFSKRIFLSVAMVVLLCLPVSAQEQTSIYRVMRKGEQIGTMRLSKRTAGDELFLKMVSNIEVRLVFRVAVHTTDQSHFKNRTLLRSDVCRRVNDRKNVVKKTWLIPNGYQTQSGSQLGVVPGRIRYNMMLLYCEEPVNIRTVYSDNFQKFVPVKPVGEHRYRVELPDGNYNEYHFVNGHCSRVDVYHSLYEFSLELS